MTDFDYDVYLKKRIAWGYRNKKNGSKSKRCSLASDGITQKQWRERNGEIMSYNLSEPMSWETFKTMPIDLQTEYIEGLRDKYGTTATDLAKFFDCVPSTVTKYCKRVLDVEFKPGQRMTKAQREAFADFCGTENDEPDEDYIEGEDFACRELIEPPIEFVRQPRETGNAFNMKEIHMSFSGCFNADSLRNSLIATIGNGTPVKIDIRCSIET